MPEAKESEVERHPLYAKLDPLLPQQLELRRREIVASAKGDEENLSDEALEELCLITSMLRKRSAGPPKAAKALGASKPKLENLLEGLE